MQVLLMVMKKKRRRKTTPIHQEKGSHGVTHPTSVQLLWRNKAYSGLAVKNTLSGNNVVLLDYWIGFPVCRKYQLAMLWKRVSLCPI